MFSFLELTDGTATTACELTDNVRFALVHYAPAVSPLRDALFGPLYADVQDQITLHALGTTAAEAYANAAAVVALLDAAREWWDDLSGSLPAVRLRAAAQDSTLAAPLEAVIKGRARGGAPDLALPAMWSEQFGKYVIQNITINFVRCGQWTRASDTFGPSASVGQTPTSVTLSPTHTMKSPIDLAINFPAGLGTTLSAGILAVGSLASDVQQIEAETMAAAAQYSSVADAAALASGGNVLRFTPADTNAHSSSRGPLTGGTMFDNLAIYAVLRNNSGTTTFTVIAEVNQALAGQVDTPVQYIDTSTTSPRIVFLGAVSVARGAVGIGVRCQASAAAGTLDIDRLVVVNTRGPGVGIVQLSALTAGVPAGAFAVHLNQSPLSMAVPQVFADDGALGAPISYSGALPFYVSGTNVQAIWFATRGTFWRYVDNVNALVNITFTVARWRGYAVPQ